MMENREITIADITNLISTESDVKEFLNILFNDLTETTNDMFQRVEDPIPPVFYSKKHMVYMVSYKTIVRAFASMSTDGKEKMIAYYLSVGAMAEDDGRMAIFFIVSVLEKYFKLTYMNELKVTGKTRRLTLKPFISMIMANGEIEVEMRAVPISRNVLLENARVDDELLQSLNNLLTLVLYPLQLPLA